MKLPQVHGVIAAHVVAGLLFLAPAYLRPDSVAVYSYIRSAAFDGDFVFFNEWAMTGLVRGGVTMFSEVTPAGALANHWWIGTSMLVAPAYLPARFFGGDGFTGIYGVILAWCSVAFVAAAMWIAWKRVRDPLALVAVTLGTPLFFYTYRLPLGTHAAGVFCVALIVLGVVRKDARLTALAAGLAIATRLQHLVLLPAVVYALSSFLFADPSGGEAPRGKRWNALVVPALLLAVPLVAQGAAWWAVYGTPLGPLTRGANLQGTTWMPFQHIALLPVLFSSYHGLFSWSPVALLAVAGWFVGLRNERAMAVTLLLMFAGEWLANGTFDRYFWGGTSFGARRFVDLAVPFAIGLAWLFSAARWTRLLAVPAVLWSVLLMLGAASGRLSMARYVGAGDLFAAALHPRPFDLHLPPLWQTLIAIGIVAAASYLMRRFFAIAIVSAALGAILVASLTPPRALPEGRRLGIDLAASRHAGPLIDERRLLEDEIAYFRAAGEEDRAAKTMGEIREIDARLRAGFQ